MEKYVSVETVRSIFRDWACCTADVDEFMSDIDEVSTSDVAPVRRARWEMVTAGGNAHQACSFCHVGCNAGLWWSYCPNCGARMDGQAQ